MSHWSSGLTCLLPATRVTGSNPLGGTYESGILLIGLSRYTLPFSYNWKIIQQTETRVSMVVGFVIKRKLESFRNKLLMPRNSQDFWKQNSTEFRKKYFTVFRQTYKQWWASYFKKWLSYFTSVTCKSNSLLLIRYPFFIVTVPLQLLVTDILNVTK